LSSSQAPAGTLERGGFVAKYSFLPGAEKMPFECWECGEHFLPQICHKAKRTEKDNGGFLRVTEGQFFVAKRPFGASFIRIFPSKLLI
jgi:hypothetical protein